MVNYCCVRNCGRNSRLNKHLNFYSLPKERNRQIQWLKAAGRDDLLTRDPSKLAASRRFCSRHFPPASIKNNRHLCPDALPSACMPGAADEDESDEDPLTHTDIVCNSCSEQIVGFRYKCVTCTDFDLCQKCEMLEAHPEHYMLRIPKPLKFKIADSLASKWRKLFKAEHITANMCDSETEHVVDSASSDDDEPITKYARNYDSGVDLAEDVKEKIRKEVSRVLKLKPEEKIITPKRTKKRQKDKEEKIPETPSKRLKFEKEGEVGQSVYAPEMVFADVNEEAMMDMKPVFPMMSAPQTVNVSSIEGPSGPIPLPSLAAQPVMHVKLSDDLSELMIEVTTSNNHKTIYKYSDIK